MKTQKCKVIRAFMMDGKPVPVGKEVTLSMGFATELRTANKVEFVPDAPPPAPVKEQPTTSAVTTPAVTTEGGKGSDPKENKGQVKGGK